MSFFLLEFPLLSFLVSSIGSNYICGEIIGTGGLEAVDGSRTSFVPRGMFRGCIEPLEEVLKVSILLPCDAVRIIRVLRSDTERIEFVMHLHNADMGGHTHREECIIPLDVE